MAIDVKYERLSCMKPSDLREQVMELDFRLVESQDLGTRLVKIPELGLTRDSMSHTEVSGQAVCGVAEFSNADDSDAFIFWTVNDGVVTIRVQDRLVTIDTRYFDRPDCPKTCQGKAGDE